MPHVAPSRYATFVAIAAGGCAADLLTKHWAFDRLGMPGGPTHWLIPEYFGFQTSLNQGALFGLGQGQVWLFALASVVAAIGILYWLFVVGAAHDAWLNVALAAIMGGVLGNLHDRLGLWADPQQTEPRYAVRDFILVQYREWVWPNFNLADSLLVCGAALLVWHAFRYQPPKSAASTTGPAAA